MTDLYAITGLPTDSEEYLALSSRVQIIQPVDLEWIPAISKVMVRHPSPGVVIPEDFRLVPTAAECAKIDKDGLRLQSLYGDLGGCARFFMAGKAYFATANVNGGLGSSVDAAAWAVAAYVDQHPTASLWAADVSVGSTGLFVMNVHNGRDVDLGSLPADAFYQVLVAKLTGSCCR